MYVSFFGLLLKQDYITMAGLQTLKDVFFHTDTDDTGMLILFWCQSCYISMGTHALSVTTVFNLNHMIVPLCERIISAVFLLTVFTFIS